MARPLELTWDELNAAAAADALGHARMCRQRPVVPVAAQCRACRGVPAPCAHAEWSGVPLVGARAGGRSTRDAVEIVCEGADRGSEPDHPEPMHFARSLPLAKALHRDTLLALRMNGEPLTPSHGFPVRLLVPGWYGVASVKWLTRLEASASRSAAIFRR